MRRFFAESQKVVSPTILGKPGEGIADSSVKRYNRAQRHALHPKLMRKNFFRKLIKTQVTQELAEVENRYIKYLMRFGKNRMWSRKR